MNTVKIDYELEYSAENIGEFITSLRGTIGLTRKEQTNALQIILLNLVYFSFCRLVTPRAKKMLAPSRINPLGIGAKSLVTVLDALESTGHVLQTLGSKDLGRNTGIATTIVATDKLKSLLNYHGFFKHLVNRSSNAECLLLRNSETIHDNKSLKDYTDNYRTNMMRVELVKYSSLLSDTDICVTENNNNQEIDLNSEFVTRKFIDFGIHDTDGTELFAFGGRMYAAWCNLSKEQRSRITINGEECIELDYPASHVNVMYKSVTGDWYRVGDPYELEVDGTEIPRHLVKKLSSIMLNVSSVTAARRSLQSAYIKRGQGNEDLEGNSDGEDYIRAADGVGIPSIIQAYLEKHQVVAHLFLQDKQTGAHNQYLESELIMDVVNKLTAMEIPCLTIFDSVIVPRQHESILKELMDTAEFPNRLP